MTKALRVKFWGAEQWIVNTPQYCGKKLDLMQGYQCSLHMHPVKDETFYVESGLVRLELGDETMILQAGDSARIRPGTWHRFTGLFPSIIFEFSTHHDETDVVRKEESRRVDLINQQTGEKA
jgi:mannose-6-phosphate isomerase-like protein (cupin superfamily)